MLEGEQTRDKASTSLEFKTSNLDACPTACFLSASISAVAINILACVALMPCGSVSKATRSSDEVKVGVAALLPDLGAMGEPS